MPKGIRMIAGSYYESFLLDDNEAMKQSLQSLQKKTETLSLYRIPKLKVSGGNLMENYASNKIPVEAQFAQIILQDEVLSECTFHLASWNLTGAATTKCFGLTFGDTGNNPNLKIRADIFRNSQGGASDDLIGRVKQSILLQDLVNEGILKLNIQ